MSAQSDLENESSCALRLQVIGGDQDAVSKRSSRRMPRFETRAVVAEFAVGVPVHVVRAPVSADPRLEINRRLGLRVEICGDLDKDLIAHARFRATELSEETDASAFRLERQDPGEAPAHDLAFNRPSSFVKHVASLPFEFQQEACGTKMLGFVLHGWWLLVSRDRYTPRGLHLKGRIVHSALQAQPQVLGESLTRSSPEGASEGRGMMASSAWVRTLGTSGWRSAPASGLRWKRLTARTSFPVEVELLSRRGAGGFYRTQTSLLKESDEAGRSIVRSQAASVFVSADFPLMPRSGHTPRICRQTRPRACSH